MKEQEDKGNWVEIGRRTVLTNSQKTASYSYLDPASSEAQLYYRIGFQALNGDLSYSKILSLISSRESVQVFGNPFVNQLSIYIDIPQQGDFRLEVMDLRGKKMLEHSFYKGISVQKFEFETAHFPSGIYFLKVSSKDFNFAQRILKQ